MGAEHLSGGNSSFSLFSETPETVRMRMRVNREEQGLGAAGHRLT
jgi:hypothetical protein